MYKLSKGGAHKLTDKNNIISEDKHFDADRPIEQRSEDLLGRRTFAEAIADQIRTVPAKHGFTIAVVGEWGSGKTSILNMVKDTLSGDADSIAVIHFNPWLFSNADDLVARFFRELSAQLGQKSLEGLKEVTNELAKLSEILAPLSPVPGTPYLARLIAGLTNLWNKASSLLNTREKLAKDLLKSKLRIVVLIDDIDRLEDRETREVMRLVRLTSDLPKVIFLLAFDKQRVAKSLDQDPDEGGKYLHKIVQVTYDLPIVRETILPRTLFAWLDELIPDKYLAQLDQEIWRRVFQEIIKPLLLNPRDVKRYVFSLQVTIHSIGEEVALADILGLEAIRILRPRLFELLKANVDHLVDAYHPSALWKLPEDRDKEAKLAMEELLQCAGDDGDVMESVLDILFPVTNKHFGRGYFGPSEVSIWRSQRRVACQDVLRIYLQGGLDEDALAYPEIRRLVEALTDDGEMAKLLDDMDEEQFERAIERLSDFEREFPREAAPIAVPVLVNRMGRLRADTPRILDVPPRSKMYFVVRALMKKLTGNKDVAELIGKMLSKITLLSGRVVLVAMVGHRDRIGARLVNQDHAEKLEDELIQQLKSATTQQLAHEWDLFGLLTGVVRWLDREEKGILVDKLREHLEDDGFVLTLLRTAVTYASFNGHVEKRLFWNDLIKIFSEELHVSIKRLSESAMHDDLSANDQEVVQLAQQYVAGKGPKALHEWTE